MTFLVGKTHVITKRFVDNPAQTLFLLTDKLLNYYTPLAKRSSKNCTGFTKRNGSWSFFPYGQKIKHDVKDKTTFDYLFLT